MIKLYVPTEQELEIVQYKKELYRKEHKRLEEVTEQDEIIIALVHAIRTFDYYYTYSDSINTYRSWDGVRELISSKIMEVEDDIIKLHLSTHFNSDNCAQVGSIFNWPQYMYKITPYARLVWETGSDEKACWLIGLKEWVDRLTQYAKEGCCVGRVVYSNNIPKAEELLKNSDLWFDKYELFKPITVNCKFWKELTKFAKLYRRGVIRFTDLRTILNHNAEICFIESAEILFLGNFYMLFIEQ